MAAEAFEVTIVLIAWSAFYFRHQALRTVEEQKGKLVVSEATAREANLQTFG